MSILWNKENKKHSRLQINLFHRAYLLEMEMRHKIELALVFLAGTMVYLTFSPADERNFWQYWAVVWFFFSFGYLFDVMFTPELSFVFDPNADNWRRKTDPQS